MSPSKGKTSLPPVAKRRYSTAFDAWNSSATGHQRPDNTPGSTTGWRESRNRKINSQFRAADSSGGERLSDTWGAGAEDWDDKLKANVPKELRLRHGGRSVMDMLVKPGVMRKGLQPLENQVQGKSLGDEALVEMRRKEDEQREKVDEPQRKIFDGVVVYVNGSTYPLISDHKLKHILSENGGNMSLHLGRRKVTHVILGRPTGSGRGAGGGLAGAKLEKEIKKIHGVGVKFVGAEWVLESLKAGKRLPETRFANMKVAAKGQGSVYNLYAKPAADSGC